MKTAILSVAASLCCFGFAHTYASTYYSNQDSDGYYSSSGTSANYESRMEPQRRSHISVSVNTHRQTSHDQDETYYVPRHPSQHKHKHQVKLQWSHGNDVLSEDAVIGGGEYNRALYICRGKYRGGIHPGKLIGNKCHIGWDGREILLSRYEILESHKILNWVPANHGDFPVNAVQGGIDERGTPLYICQTTYRGGMHPGKIVEQACQIPWGGKEIANPYYQVLVN